MSNVVQEFFHSCHQIVGKKRGEPVLNLHLVFHSKTEEIMGFGKIVSKKYPPYLNSFRLTGSFRVVSQNNEPTIIINANDEAYIHYNPFLPPLLRRNIFDLNMILLLDNMITPSNSKIGSAYYRYFTKKHDMLGFEGTIKTIPCGSLKK